MSLWREYLEKADHDPKPFTFRDLDEASRAFAPTPEFIAHQKRTTDAIMAHGLAAHTEANAMIEALVKRGFPLHKLVLVEEGYRLYVAYLPMQGEPMRRLTHSILSVRARMDAALGKSHE